MKDQADTLRRIMESRESRDSRRGGSESQGPSVPVVTFASGKGGVGKTSLVANLGTQLARSGLRVMLVDGDFGLANLDILLGVQAGATLEQVLDGSSTLQEAVIGVEPNLWLLPASAGLLELRSADRLVRNRLLALFENCPWEMDLILVDVGAGIQQNVLSLHSPLYTSVVVLTPEPTSITDAYSLIKLIRRNEGVTHVSVIVNQVTDAPEAQAAFRKLKDVAGRFLDVELEYLGHCERDEKFIRAVMKRKILLDLERGAPSLPCLDLLARRLRSKCSGIGAESAVPGIRQGSTRLLNRFQDEPAHGAPGNTAGFWRALLGEVKA